MRLTEARAKLDLAEVATEEHAQVSDDSGPPIGLLSRNCQIAHYSMPHSKIYYTGYRGFDESLHAANAI